MGKIGITLAVVLSWPGLSLTGQIAPTSDIAPAIVVKVPSASLGSEQIASMNTWTADIEQSRPATVAPLLASR
jgi:hypothetical protein